MQVQNIVVTSVSEEYETVIAQPLASVLFLLIMSQPDDLFLTIFLTPCVCVCVYADCILLMKSSTVVHAQSIIHRHQKAQCLVAPQF